MKPKLVVIALSCLALAACSSQTAGTGTAVAPITSTSTSVTSSVASTSSASETSSASSSTQSSSTSRTSATSTSRTTAETSSSSGSGGDALATVTIGALDTYTFDTGLFTIDVPAKWTLQNNSKTGEAIVLWTDETGNAVIAVDVFQETQPQSAAQLEEFLKNFLTSTVAPAGSDFTTEAGETQTDGSVLIVWNYTATATDGTKGLLTGNSFIEQREDKVSILTTLVPDAQFDALLDKTNSIINSYVLDTTAALP